MASFRRGFGEVAPPRPVRHGGQGQEPYGHHPIVVAGSGRTCLARRPADPDHAPAPPRARGSRSSRGHDRHRGPFRSSWPAARVAAASKAAQQAFRMPRRRDSSDASTGRASAAVSADGMPKSVPLPPSRRSMTTTSATAVGVRSQPPVQPPGHIGLRRSRAPRARPPSLATPAIARPVEAQANTRFRA